MKISKINNIRLFKQDFKKNTSKSPVFNAFSTSNFDIFHNNNSLLNLSLINFQGKKVDKKDDFIDNFKKLLNSDSPDEIFLFLDKELRKKAQEKGIMSEIIDDVVQNAILDILLIFEAFNNGEISNDELISSVNEIYLNLKPKKEDYVSNYKTTSLDSTILDSNKTLTDTIPDNEKHKVKYLTPADDKKRQADKKRLQEKLDNTDLSDKEKEFLLSREDEDGKVSYKAIAEKQGVSDTIAKKIILGAIYKIKKQQNRLTQDDLKNINDVVERFKKYGLTFEDYLDAAIDEPRLFSKSADEIEIKIKGVVDYFKDYGLTLEKYLPACLNQPSLFYQSPETICANVSGVVDNFKDYGLTYENYLSACINQPQLFCQSPETIYANVSGVVNNFKDYGLTYEKYLPACIKRPQLFYRSPKTICANVSGVVDKFKDNGLTHKNYLPACIKQSSLFSRSPETICANVNGVVDNFKDYGLTLEKYLPACLNQPQLFYQSPKTITEHIKGLIFIFKNMDEKLTQDEIIEKILKKYVRITCTNKTNYGLLLRKKMFPNKAPKGLGGEGKINSKIENYLKENPNSKFSFTIKDDEMAQEFVEYARELAKNAIDREDVFDITIEK